MQFIKVGTIEEFNDLQNRIHRHRINTVAGYNAERWANPIVGIDGTIICPIEESDYSALAEGEVPETISPEDENYFTKSNI